MESGLFLFKLGLVAFWAVWLFIAFVTNLIEGLKHIRLLPSRATWASHNYGAIKHALRGAHAPSWLAPFLFAGVLGWQGVTVGLFVWALVTSDGSIPWHAVNMAFSAGLGLLAMFMLVDEISRDYELERGHALLFIAQLLSFIALYVLRI